MRPGAHFRALGALIVLAVLAPCSAQASSALLEVGTSVGLGYDSNNALLASPTPVPSPGRWVVEEEPREAGLAGLTASMEGWVRPVTWLTLGFDHVLVFEQFFDTESLLAPGTDMWLRLRPVEPFSVQLGAAYGYNRHSFLPEQRYHQPGAFIELSLHGEAHVLSLGYALSHRILVGMDHDSETEQVIDLAWRARLLGGVLELGLGVWAGRIRGTQDYMQLDSIGAELLVSFEHRRIAGGVSYCPSGVRLEEGVGLASDLTLWFGVDWTSFLGTSLRYGYERLDDLRDLPDGTEYERHVVMLLFEFSWKWRKTDGPVSLPRGEEGILVDGERVTVTLHAPDASSVTLTGSHDGWKSSIPLDGPDSDGMWTVTVSLPVGRHEVTCLVDGQTKAPFGAPSYTDDGFGGRNAVVLISP